ncbi:MAG: molybdopterin molybdotransferase MoeA [Anaerolineae bacterium]|jgi:molybdopterin molybdotransferase
MPELFTLVPPDQARATLFEHLPVAVQTEVIPTAEALGRVTAAPLHSPMALPAFARSSKDGYAVRAADTLGASESVPAYLTVVGEVPMGQAATVEVGPGQTAIAHTGGMIPPGADGVVMVERTQKLDEQNIEVLRPVAAGENIINVGEDILQGDAILPAGHLLRPQDVGGLLAVGLTEISVARRPRVALIATGDEVIPPSQALEPGQVRDINTYTLSGLVQQAGGQPWPLGIVSDRFEALKAAAARGLAEADVVIMSAGSSVSVRDMTADVINELGQPGVLVHGISFRPGKPTVLAICDGKPVFGLPGNPVSVMVVFGLLVTPTLWRWQGLAHPPEPRTTKARLARNVAGMAGREDRVPVRLEQRDDGLWAAPVFGQSNLIFTLVKADGMVKIPLDETGISAGEWVEVRLF